MLALYTEPDTQGNIIGLRTDLSREFTRVETSFVGASNIYWCGSKSIVISVNKQLVIVVRSAEPLELKSTEFGIFCSTEDDGLRVVTPDNTFFLELVAESTV
jgi:hypothetical protein